MKKNLVSLIILFVTTSLLTGCENTKTLTCTSGTGDDSEEIYTYKFSKDQLKTIIVKEIVKVESKEEGEKYKKQAEEEMKLFADKPLSLKVTVKDKEVIAVTEIDVEKLSDEDREGLDNITYEEMKKNSEKTGMHCK